MSEEKMDDQDKEKVRCEKIKKAVGELVGFLHEQYEKDKDWFDKYWSDKKEEEQGDHSLRYCLLMLRTTLDISMEMMKDDFPEITKKIAHDLMDIALEYGFEKETMSFECPKDMTPEEEEAWIKEKFMEASEKMIKTKLDYDTENHKEEE